LEPYYKSNTKATLLQVRQSSKNKEPYKIYMVTLQREAQANSTQIRKMNVLGLANAAMPV